MELEHGQVGAAVGIQFHDEIRSTSGRSRGSVQVRRQLSELVRILLEAHHASGGPGEHLGPVRRARVCPDVSGSREIEIIKSEIVSIRPYAHLRIVWEICKGKPIPVVGAGGIGGRGDGDTFEVIARAVDGKLGNDPTLSRRVKPYDRIAAVVVLTGTAES